jgi:hypothetical protein
LSYLSSFSPFFANFEKIREKLRTYNESHSITAKKQLTVWMGSSSFIGCIGFQYNQLDQTTAQIADLNSEKLKLE